MKTKGDLVVVFVLIVVVMNGLTLKILKDCLPECRTHEMPLCLKWQYNGSWHLAQGGSKLFTDCLDGCRQFLCKTGWARVLLAQLLVELWAPVPACAAWLILGEEVWHPRGQKMKAVACSPRVCADGFECKELIWACRWVILLILTLSLCPVHSAVVARCSLQPLPALGLSILLLPLLLLSLQSSPTWGSAGVASLFLPWGDWMVQRQQQQPLPVQSLQGFQLHVHFPGQITQPWAGIILQLGHEGAATYGESTCLGEIMGGGGAAGLYLAPTSFLSCLPAVF